MSRYSGRHFKGAAKGIRADKRREAEERNAKTPFERRRQYRRVIGAVETILAPERAS